MCNDAAPESGSLSQQACAARPRSFDRADHQSQQAASSRHAEAINHLTPVMSFLKPGHTVDHHHSMITTSLMIGRLLVSLLLAKTSVHEATGGRDRCHLMAIGLVVTGEVNGHLRLVDELLEVRRRLKLASLGQQEAFRDDRRHRSLSPGQHVSLALDRIRSISLDFARFRHDERLD